MKCVNCGEAMMTEAKEDYRYTESGLSNVILQGVTVRRCPRCNEVEVAIPAIVGLHRAIARLLASKAGALLGEEVRFLRKHLGLSGVDFAAELGVTPETVSRWESGAQAMGQPNERLLRIWIRMRKPISKYPEQEGRQRKPARMVLRPNSSGWATAAPQ